LSDLPKTREKLLSLNVATYVSGKNVLVN